MEAIDFTRDIINGVNQSVHDRFYYSSNEDLDSLFQNIDVRGKNVLTVLASSDQLFHILLMHPASVETFDINRLSKYYYYLRMWSIVFFEQYYPCVFSNGFIYHLLKKVKPKTLEEEEAFQYWSLYIQNFCSFMTRDLFYVSSQPEKNKISHLKELKEQLLFYSNSFYHMDISQNHLLKKYDLIIASNISEYFCYDIARMNGFYHNVSHMLSDHGELLCSYFMRDYGSVLEKSTFQNGFMGRNIYDSSHHNIGCVYQKKMSTKNS